VIEFYLSGDGDAYTPSLIRGRRNRPITVNASTLDDFVVDHRRPDLIKMDIEGAEVMALEGATKLRSGANAPKWLIEVHSSEIDRQVRKILSDHGYSLRLLPAPFPRRPYPTHIIALK
jgi:hypothetical protein